MEIRDCRTEEYPKIGELIKRIYLGNYLKAMDCEGFIAKWGKISETQECKTIVAVKEEAIIGAIGGVIYPEMWDNDKVASEFFWFVDKACRSQGVGRKLYLEFERWAKEMGCNKLRMTHHIEWMKNIASVFYKSAGLHPIEMLYEKELVKCHSEP